MISAVAPSGSGKTNFVYNLLQLFCAGKGTFDHIMIFGKSRDEPLYQYLRDKIKGEIKVYEGLTKLPPINNDLNKNPSKPSSL